MGNRIVYAAMATVMAGAPMFGTVSADQVWSEDNVSSINITRTVSGVTNKFSNNFGYTITASETNPAPVVGLADSFSIDFAETDAILNNSISKVATIDLSGVTFSKLGDYEFVIKEVSSTDPVNFPVDSENEYTLLASVRNVLDEYGKPTGDLEAKFLAQLRDANSDKTDDVKFEKTAVRGKIELSNTLQGSMADSNAYFKYKINLINAKAGDVFTVTGQDAEINYGGETIVTAPEIVAGQDNYVYLKHGQNVTIGSKDGLNELPIGLTYTIEELDATDYETLIDGNVDEDKATEVKTVKADLSEDASEEEVAEYKLSNVTAYVNKKEANVLTGVMLGILPFMVAGSFGAVAYIASRRKM